MRKMDAPPSSSSPISLGERFGLDGGRDRRIYRARAPLRLGLAGGGTDLSPYSDLHGGATLNVTIDRFAFASLARRDGDVVVLRANDLDVEERHAAGPAADRPRARPAPRRLQSHRAAVPRRPPSRHRSLDRDRGAAGLGARLLVGAGGGAGRGLSRSLRPAAGSLRRGAGRVRDRAARAGPGGRQAGPIRRRLRRGQFHRVPSGRPRRRQSAAGGAGDLERAAKLGGGLLLRAVARFRCHHPRSDAGDRGRRQSRRWRRCTCSSRTRST